jgi:hypothetical protein
MTKMRVAYFDVRAGMEMIINDNRITDTAWSSLTGGRNLILKLLPSQV